MIWVELSSPREIRRTLRIRESDPLEIFTDRREIILKKYSPIGEMKYICKTVCGKSGTGIRADDADCGS